MTIKSIRKYYSGKNSIPCPLTEKLVKAGYQQRSGGYITNAKREGITVDYTKNLPSQYWHLMYYCQIKNDADIFTRQSVCGELLFWMAEVARCVPTVELEKLVDDIIVNPVCIEGNRPVYDRKKWNVVIQQICFDRIVEIVEKQGK